ENDVPVKVADSHSKHIGSHDPPESEYVSSVHELRGLRIEKFGFQIFQVLAYIFSTSHEEY
ncbi:hypothetical protein, partial [Aeribacillus pallidus]|uniref:hypothetical protein n=1 Tax=Aeribacillus pallidus TaxID=33936 RepID=UPI001966D6AA